MVQGTRKLRRQRIAGEVLMALIVLGLVYVVFWVATARPLHTYPGIEKLRGAASQDATAKVAALRGADDYAVSLPASRPGGISGALMRG